MIQNIPTTIKRMTDRTFTELKNKIGRRYKVEIKLESIKVKSTEQNKQEIEIEMKVKYEEYEYSYKINN